MIRLLKVPTVFLQETFHGSRRACVALVAWILVRDAVRPVGESVRLRDNRVPQPDGV
jgi:hypothetical protein